MNTAKAEQVDLSSWNVPERISATDVVYNLIARRGPLSGLELCALEVALDFEVDDIYDAISYLCTYRYICPFGRDTNGVQQYRLTTT